MIKLLNRVDMLFMRNKLWKKSIEKKEKMMIIALQQCPMAIFKMIHYLLNIFNVSDSISN